MSKSPITIDRDDVGDPADWLHNPHAGEMVRLDFMEPLKLDARTLAQRVGVDTDRLASVLDGRQRIDADLDLRLGRYFGMSAGFFLGLQVEHDLLEARRALNGALDDIVPRAA